MMSERENCLRAVTMKGPEWIPCRVNIQGADTWLELGEWVEELIERHPSFGYLPEQRQMVLAKAGSLGYRVSGRTLIDEWGCGWHHLIDGISGEVVNHPLKDWESLQSYRPPPENPVFAECPPEGRKTTDADLSADGDDIRRRTEEARRRGEMTWGSTGHFLFQRLTHLRGFENFMADVATEPPELKRLTDLIARHTTQLVDRWIEIGVDVVSFGDDLGNQQSLMISPRSFRRLFFPSYSRVFTRVRTAGPHVYLHSDGHVLEIADDLVKTGISILNIRVFQNEGIEEVRRAFKGRVCLDVGTDKQFVIPHGSPADVEDYVRGLATELSGPEGGLILTFNFGGPDMCRVPIENIRALLLAIGRYQAYWKQR